MKDVLRVNAAYKVDNASIQRIQHNGREHIIIPSFTLPDNVVMNGGLYPADEIAKSFKSLLGTPAPIGHPVINGKAVSAKRMDAINAHYVGVWNEKVEYDASSNRVYVEKWVDVEFAEKFEQGKRLLDAINAGLPLHTSTGLHCRREQVTNGAAGYTWIARDMVFDHDAILFDEPGAATPEDGVGLMVNSAELVVNAMLPTLQTNQALPNSYGQKREALQAALREVFGNNDCNPWVEDFNDSAVIFHQGGYKMVSYEMDGPAIVLGDTVTEMQTRTEFVAKGATVVTTIALTGNSVECEPVKPIDNAEKPDEMKPEDITKAIADAVGPLTAKIDTLVAENASLRAEMETNAKKGDAPVRAAIIKARPELEQVANSLSGELLENLAASVAVAAPLASGALETNAQDATKEFDKYEGV